MDKARAGDLLIEIFRKLEPEFTELEPFSQSLEIILSQNLSSRIISCLGKNPDEKAVHETWLKLSGCLGNGSLFR